MDRTIRLFPAQIASGLAIGLYVARVVAEATRTPWSPLALAALTVCSCLAFAWLSRRLDRRGVSLPVVPAFVLLVYTVWPQREGGIALAVAAVALLAWAVGASRSGRRCMSRFTLVDVLTFAIAFVVYLATLQKDILPADSGEFQLTVTTMAGVLHQPGYPLYTLAGKVFTLLPFGTPALRLNLLSALLAAGTLSLVGATVRLMLDGRRGAVWGGLAAVLALGTATTFWAQATTANIRMPTAFFTAWCLYLLMAYRRSRIANLGPHVADRYLILFALAFSLGLGHYFVLAFIGLFFILYIVLVDPMLVRQPRRWWRALVVLALAQLVWLYLPLHAAVAPSPQTQGLLSPGYLVWYALGQGFAGDILALAGPEHLPFRLALLPMLFPFQMNFALLAAALAGAAALIWRDWRTGLTLVGAFLVHTFITITYRAPQTVEYEMPAYVILAILIGYGAGWVFDLQFPVPSVKSAFSNVLAAGVIVAGVANGVVHAPSFLVLASDRSTREYVEPILRDAPASAVILSDWHYATPMWYMQQVEGLRRDVDVRYVFPIGGQEWSQVWRGLIQDNVVQRPVIVTHYWGLQYATLPYRFEPFGQAWLVRAEPSFDAPRDLTPVSDDFGGQIRLLGYRASLTHSSPGRPLEVTLAWQAAGQSEQDYSLTVQILDPNGARRAQQDRGYPTRTFAPGEVRVDRFTLPLEPTLAPGRYAISVGVYYAPPEGCCRNLTTRDGAQLATLTTLELAPGDEALPTLHPLDIPFAGGPTLTGVDYDLSHPSSVRVYLHWRGPSPSGVVAHIGGAAATVPALPAGAVFVTGHDVPTGTPLVLNVTDQNGLIRTGATVWGWPVAGLRLPGYSSNDRYVLLSDQMLLTAVESPRREVRPGQVVDVTLRFLSLRPLVTDNVASIRLEGAKGAWRVSSDDRPAGNAFPTLKWIAGSRVDDRRRLAPVGAAPGPASGHLTVYDAFREEVLSPLDARMGDSVPLGEWNVE